MQRAGPCIASLCGPMAALADLQPDRRAVLQLLVGRGRGYDQIAELLTLPEIVVRRRAHDAITTLAGGPAGVDDAQRALLCDYLVGELPASRRAEARTLLADDAGARRFARTATARLSVIPGAQLPELPAEDEEVADALDALDARRERQVQLQSSSKLGARLLIAAIVIAVVALVIVLSLVVADGGDGDSGASDTPAAETSAAATSPDLVAELTSPSGGTATGEAALRPAGTGPVSLAVRAEGLDPTRQLEGDRFTAYAFWLTGPDDTVPLRLGFYDAQDAADGVAAADGTLELVAKLDGTVTPAVDAATLEKYTEVVISREVLESVEDRPEEPGNVVLSGELKTLQ